MDLYTYGALRRLHIRLHEECIERRLLPWYSVIPYESSPKEVQKLEEKLRAKMSRHEFMGLLETLMREPNQPAQEWITWCLFRNLLTSEAAIAALSARRLQEQEA